GPFRGSIGRPSCSLRIRSAAATGDSPTMRWDEGSIQPLLFTSARSWSRAPTWSHGPEGFRWPISTCEGRPVRPITRNAERQNPPSGISRVVIGRSTGANRVNFRSVAMAGPIRYRPSTLLTHGRPWRHRGDVESFRHALRRTFISIGLVRRATHGTESVFHRHRRIGQIDDGVRVPTLDEFPGPRLRDGKPRPGRRGAAIFSGPRRAGLRRPEGSHGGTRPRAEWRAGRRRRHDRDEREGTRE